jgi:hypothetical protein
MRFIVFVATNLIVVSAIWLRALWWRRRDDRAGHATPARVIRVRRRYAIRPALL